MYNTNPNDNANNYNTNNYTSAPGSYGQVPPALYNQAPATAPKSNNKKVVIGIIAGFALLCAAAGSMKGQNSAGGFGQPGQYNPAQTAMYTPQYNGQPSQNGDTNTFMPSNNADNTPQADNASQNGVYTPRGAYTYNTPETMPASPDNGNGAVIDGYWDRQRQQEQGFIAEDETIRDTNTVQDANGMVYTDVDNSVANPAIDAGVVTEVPTSELPTSYDTPAPAAEAPAADTSTASE